MVEPIVGNDLTGNIQNQTTQGVALIGVGVYTPVQLLKVFVNRTFNIDPALASVTSAVTLFTIDNVSTQRLEVATIKKRMFNGVLHLFNVRRHDI